MTCQRLLTVLLLIGSALLLAQTTTSGSRATVGTSDRTSSHDDDPIYAPTPMKAVRAMLDLAGVTNRDTVYDLGSGDGRIVIEAAREYGARGIGLEIDSARVAESRENARNEGVTDLVEFRHQDIFEADISPATIVTVYLLPKTLAELRPKLLRELEPGTPIVSHDFLIRDWTPQRSRTVKTPGGWKSSSTIYRWTVPESLPEELHESSGWLESLF